MGPDRPGLDAARPPRVEARGLAVSAGGRLVQRDVGFVVGAGEVCAVLGPSGCGKSTLLRHMVGLARPGRGQVLFDGADYWSRSAGERARLGRGFGVLFQGGALWSSLTVAENVELPMRMLTGLGAAERRRRAREKLALAGLPDAADRLPAELSGGMRKRAGIARALALDPDILFLDEPSAGLDPVGARRLDDLVLALRRDLGTTFVVVTHELASIFAIADTCVFLDAAARSAAVQGPPRELRASADHPRVAAFLRREDPDAREEPRP